MEVIYQSHPDVIIGSATFRNVPTIIQHDEVPLMQVGRFVEAGFTTKFHIFHSDGTDIAVVKGSQIYATEAGKLAKIRLRYEPNLTVCELEGKPLFELRRDGPAAMRGWAEMYAPEGVLIQATGAGIAQQVAVPGDIVLWKNGLALGDSLCENVDVGLHYKGKVVTMGIGTGYITLTLLNDPEIASTRFFDLDSNDTCQMSMKRHDGTYLEPEEMEKYIVGRTKPPQRSDD